MRAPTVFADCLLRRLQRPHVAPNLRRIHPFAPLNLAGHADFRDPTASPGQRPGETLRGRHAEYSAPGRGFATPPEGSPSDGRHDLLRRGALSHSQCVLGSHEGVPPPGIRALFGLGRFSLLRQRQLRPRQAEDLPRPVGSAVDPPAGAQASRKQHTFDAELVVTLLGSPKCSIARPPTVLPRQPFRQILASSERPKVTLSLRVPANHYPVTPTVAGSGGCQQSGSGPFLEAGRWAFGATRARPPRCFLGPSLPSRFFPPGTGRLTHQNARPRTCKLRSNSP